MHAILERAKRIALPAEFEPPTGYRYDTKRGYWVHSLTDVAYVMSGDLRPPMTKKHDIETGEDQKGE